MTHLIAPGLEHQFPVEWQKKAEVEYAKHLAKGRNGYPSKVHFVTYTLKYPISDWIHILALDRHYERSVVDAERTDNGFKVTTKNICDLYLSLPNGAKGEQVVQIDGQEIKAKPNFPGLELLRHKGSWKAVATISDRPPEFQTYKLRKSSSFQGPIDDAFTDGFLCVRGTGKPWHDATQKYADANLQRFKDEWSQFMRGDLPIKEDKEVTEDDIKRNHLILFGDPSSNALIGKVLQDLPLKWTKESVRLADKVGDASTHVPALIYSNPLSYRRYIVLNSGHTFHAADFRGTNALLYPRLGDFALLKLTPTEKDKLATEVVTAGLFDEAWQIEKAAK